jgi:hypothetical protein
MGGFMTSVAAPVGAIVAALIAAIVPWYLKQRSARKKAHEQTKLAIDVVRGMGRRLPFTIDRVRIVVNITSDNGAGEIVRELIGIRPRVGERLNDFKTELATSGQFDVTKAPSVTYSDPGRGVRIEELVDDSNRYEVAVEIVGGLPYGEVALDLKLEAAVIGAHLLRASDIKKKYGKDAFKCEYVGESVETEVKELEIDIGFPPGLRPVAYPMLFFVGTETQVDDRLSDLPAVDHSVENRAKLVIPNPLPLYKYVMYWVGVR